jgi:hypothetical protein
MATDPQKAARAALMTAKGVANPQRQLNPQGLYSQAAEASKSLPQPTGTPQQFGAMLQKQGVKPAELANSGVNWQDNQLKM